MNIFAFYISSLIEILRYFIFCDSNCDFTVPSFKMIIKYDCFIFLNLLSYVCIHTHIYIYINIYIYICISIVH